MSTPPSVPRRVPGASAPRVVGAGGAREQMGPCGQHDGGDWAEGDTRVGGRASGEATACAALARTRRLTYWRGHADTRTLHAHTHGHRHIPHTHARQHTKTVLLCKHTQRHTYAPILTHTTNACTHAPTEQPGTNTQASQACIHTCVHTPAYSHTRTHTSLSSVRLRPWPLLQKL